MVRRFQLKKSFTLVELMVVVAIIGILATVVVVNVVGQTYEAKKAKVKADFASIKTALRIHKLNNSRYPRQIDELLQPSNNGKPAALEELAQDPWGNDYVYEYRSGSKYQLISYGADGQPGGDEEDQDLDIDFFKNENGQR
ncbi:MAG: type II secretion system major pseudopilin GspG [Planctomycetota bacterium]|nr:type II secretion system major pseudopilin GspG [Planctomycetota bacterium]